MKYLSILLIVLLTTGCFTLPSPASSHVAGTTTMDHKEPEPKEESNETSPEPDPDPEPYTNGMSYPVVVLLGIGAACMMVAMAASVQDDSADHPEFALITGGIGLTLWGAAGIVYLAE